MDIEKLIAAGETARLARDEAKAHLERAERIENKILSYVLQLVPYLNAANRVELVRALGGPSGSPCLVTGESEVVLVKKDTKEPKKTTKRRRRPSKKAREKSRKYTSVPTKRRISAVVTDAGTKIPVPVPDLKAEGTRPAEMKRTPQLRPEEVKETTVQPVSMSSLQDRATLVKILTESRADEVYPEIISEIRAESTDKVTAVASGSKTVGATPKQSKTTKKDVKKYVTGFGGAKQKSTMVVHRPDV